MNLKAYRKQANDLLSRRRYAIEQVKREAADLLAAHEIMANTVEAQGVLQTVAKTVQQQAHDRIAAIVTLCLRAIFDDPYQFKIIFERTKRSATEARLVFVRDRVEYEPMDSVGGGVIDVASFALRVAALVLSRPKRRLFLALDEPFSMLSKNYLPRVREMLDMLSRDMGIQFLIVTHAQELRIGKVVEI